MSSSAAVPNETCTSTAVVRVDGKGDHGGGLARRDLASRAAHLLVAVDAAVVRLLLHGGYCERIALC